MAEVEIACFEQFLLLSQCFQKSFAVCESKMRWKRVNLLRQNFVFDLNSICTAFERMHYDLSKKLLVALSLIPTFEAFVADIHLKLLLEYGFLKTSNFSFPHDILMSLFQIVRI